MNRFLPLVCLLAFSLLSFTSILNEVELEKKAVLNGKMDMLLPKSFETLKDDKIKEGEESNVIYENEERTISLTLNYATGAANQEIIPAFLEGFAGSFDDSYDIKEWKKKKVIEANGHKVGTLEFTAKEGEAESYYLVFFTDVEDRLLVGTFYCSSEDMEEWVPLANKMVNSIKTK